MSNTAIDSSHIYDEANAGRMGAKLMAIVVEGARGRVYLSPSLDHEQVIVGLQSPWKPDVPMPENPRWFSPPLYGLKTFGDLFTSRQLVALTTFSDLVGEAIAKVETDAVTAGVPDDHSPLCEGGVGAKAYAEAVGVYLGFGSSRAADAWSSIVTWRNQVDSPRNTFARQAIPMTWDFTEVSPFSDSAGNWIGNSVKWVQESLEYLPTMGLPGDASQADAAKQKALWKTAQEKLVKNVCGIPVYEQLQLWAWKDNLDLGYELQGSINLSPPVTEKTRFTK
jgi:putative DNA methylase